MKDAIRITEHYNIKNYTKVKSWFSQTEPKKILNCWEIDTSQEIKMFYFTISYIFDNLKECATLSQPFSENECELMNTEQINMLLEYALEWVEEQYMEEQAIINELESGYY